jgi:uncharacterized protein
MYRRPILIINNAKGVNILPKLDGRWVSVKITENDGKESDTAEITCIGPANRMPLPKKGDEYEIYMGWQGGQGDEGAILQGKYKVQKVGLKGSPDEGETIVISLKAADFVDKLKAHGRESYKKGTFGELMKKVAGKAGLEAVVDPELAKEEIEHTIRYDQSLIDFANQTGERFGAVVKPMGGKLIASKRGEGKTASGKTLDDIIIKKNRSFGYDIETDTRAEAGSIAASYLDPKTGKRKLVKEKTGRDGPIFTLPHPYANEKEAKKAAKTQAFEAGNQTGSGHFESAGLPKARAGAPVIASGFGEGVDGKWKAKSLEKTINSKGGFTTTVNVEAGKDEKKV